MTFSEKTYILVCMTKRDSKKTRELILSAAFDEIYRHGYHAARTEDIIEKTKMTRGALYHHFSDKHALGKAVLTEVIADSVCKQFTEPLEGCEDPIDCLDQVITQACNQITDEEIQLGCPLCNLALEMSPVDEDFREAIDEIYSCWRKAISDAMAHGQANGKVRSDVEPEDTAYFILAAIAGCRSMAKNTQSRKVLKSTVGQLKNYLYSLRP